MSKAMLQTLDQYWSTLVTKVASVLRQISLCVLAFRFKENAKYFISNAHKTH